MINKDTYKRLTERRGSLVIDNCGNCPNVNNPEGCTDKNCYEIMKNRLVELEDKITDGTLIEIDKSLIGQGIVGIHHFTDGTYQLDLDENIVIGFSSDGVITWNGTHYYNDEFINGMFFMDNEKGKAEAEAKLKELQENK